jgi:hypothetical protein
MAVGLVDFGARNAMSSTLCVTLAMHSISPAITAKKNLTGWMVV